MLDKLFGSKTRSQLLNFFFLHPKKAFYLRELARKFDAHTNSIRRELNNLVEIGILEELDKATTSEVVEEKDAKNKTCKFYQVNKNFVLYPELESLFAKAQLLIRDKMLKKLDGVGKINLLILTGNFTGAKHIETDILIIGQVKKDKLKKVINKFETEIGKDIYYTVMSRKEFSKRRGLTDCFIFDILTSRKLILLDTLGISKNDK